MLLVFFLLGPILTLGIVGTIVLRKLPANARNWEQTLSQQTGLHWKIKSVEFRSPGFVRLHEVTILDDAVKPPRPIFRATHIDVQRKTDQRKEKIFPGIVKNPDESPIWSGLTNIVTSSFPSFRSDDQFWQITIPASVIVFNDYTGENSALLVQNILRKVFSRFETLADVPVLFIFEQLYVISERSLKKEGNKIDRTDLFQAVQGNIYRTPSEIRSDWSFEIKDISDVDRLYLSFTLSLTDTLEIVFRTGRQPIPCDLAAVFCSPFQNFSGGAFCGEYMFSARSGHHSHTIRLNDAIFVNVPLVPLVGPYIDFSVAGTIVDLRFERAVYEMEGGTAKNLDAVGSLRVKNGAIEKALFHRCVGNFQLNVKPENVLDLPERMIPFSACAIRFRLQPGGIEFSADELWEDKERGDAIMYLEGDSIGSPLKMIVRLPQQRRIVTHEELMFMFTANGAPVVPLTTRSQSLLQRVPLQ